MRSRGADVSIRKVFAHCQLSARYTASTSAGIWNPHVQPPWNSDYTTNINTEMNYWPAETTHLSECHEPLIQMIRELSVSGARTAKIHYGARGWVAHHNVDLANGQPERWQGHVGFLANGRRMAVPASMGALPIPTGSRIFAGNGLSAYEGCGIVLPGLAY